MAFRPRTDLNPDIAVQDAQTSHLDISNALLPNTVKDGSGNYYSPLLDSDGKLQVVTSGSTDISHGTITAALANTSYASGTHQTNSVDVTSSTGLISIQGSITGGLVGQSVSIRASHDNNSFFELHNVHVNLVVNGSYLEFLINFQCAMKYIQLLYKNDDVISRTLNATLSYKN